MQFPIENTTSADLIVFNNYCICNNYCLYLSFALPVLRRFERRADETLRINIPFGIFGVSYLSPRILLVAIDTASNYACRAGIINVDASVYDTFFSCALDNRESDDNDQR